MFVRVLDEVTILLMELTMIARSWKRATALPFIVLLLCTSLAAEQIGDFEQLTLEIGTAKRKLLPMEPVPITITLSNETNKAIRGHFMINPGAGYLEIYVAKAEEVFETFRSANWLIRASEGARTSVLEPGFHKSISTYLYYAHPANLEKKHHGRYVTETPGIYRIKATLKDVSGKNEIESNVLTIEAKKPKGDDAAAYEYVRSLMEIKDKDVYYGNFLLRDFEPVRHVRTQKVLDKKEEFLSRFPKSRYARYVRYSLGRTYRREKEEEQYQRGIKLLEKTASYKDFFLAEEALLVLIRDAIKRGETNRAKKYKVMFARRYPNAEEGRDYVEEMYRAPAYWWSFVWPWPLILLGAAAGVFFFVLVPLLKKKASSGSK